MDQHPKLGDTFVVLPDSEIKPWSETLNSITINLRIHSDEIKVSPCANEHWISTDLFKFRLWAEQEQKHVIGFCAKNQIPLYSLFCDEIVLISAKPVWYQKGHDSWNGLSFWDRYPNYIVDIEHGPIREQFEQISNQEVIDRFSYSKIYFLESAYNKFLVIKDSLPIDVMVAEFKSGHILDTATFTSVVGLDYVFQRDLIDKVSVDDYMSAQILGSRLLNWQFLCWGGSSNLMCVLPVQAIALKDQTIFHSVEAIIRGFTKVRQQTQLFPYINHIPDITQLTTAFNYFSENRVPFEIR
jgi:hypothetical protein